MYEGDVIIADQLSESLETLGFRLIEKQGPDKKFFGNYYLVLRSQVIDAYITLDRSQLRMEIGPVGDEKLRFTPVEWLLAAGEPLANVLLDARGQVDLLTSKRDRLDEVVSSPDDVGGWDALVGARQRVNEVFRAQGGE